MTTAIMFSRQNDASSHVRNTPYRENILLVVVLVWESKGFFFNNNNNNNNNNNEKLFQDYLSISPV